MNEPQPNLDALTKTELKAEWETRFGRPPPARILRDYLIRNLAWQRQAETHARLSKKAEQRLRQLAAAFKKDPNDQPPVADPPMKPSTRLLREWHGQVHEVIVAEDGYRYQDSLYRSLLGHCLSHHSDPLVGPRILRPQPPQWARATMKPRLHCAIYIRKSSHEELDQSFNSLDTQRTACEAFIESQRHEGWQLIPAHYDDGGYSGGTDAPPTLMRHVRAQLERLPRRGEAHHR